MGPSYKYPISRNTAAIKKVTQLTVNRANASPTIKTALRWTWLSLCVATFCAMSMVMRSLMQIPRCFNQGVFPTRLGRLQMVWSRPSTHKLCMWMLILQKIQPRIVRKYFGIVYYIGATYQTAFKHHWFGENGPLSQVWSTRFVMVNALGNGLARKDHVLG